MGVRIPLEGIVCSVAPDGNWGAIGLALGRAINEYRASFVGNDMAEGLLGRILGEEAEEPELKGSEPLAGSEVFAATVAVKLAGNDPQVARDTSVLLQEQTQLLRVQSQPLEGEQSLRLAHLRNQLRAENTQRFSQCLRAAFQVFIAPVLAPDLPAAYYSRGVALARHGDLSGAETKFEQANLRGPLWADPLKAWGDVLAN